MAQPKVLVFIVPGTWHPSSAYESFASHLRKAGYATHIASLPSFDPTDVDTSCAADTDAVRQQLLGLLEADSSDIVVFAHSYGGIPGGGAAVGLSKSSRIQNSQQGGVIGLVYMSAFIIPEGVGLSEYLGGRKPPYILQDQPSQGLCTVTGVREAFYSDLDMQPAGEIEASLRPHAGLVFTSPAPAPAWREPEFESRLLFLRCTLDEAMPLPMQDSLIERSGVHWHVKDVEASHSAFVSRPDEIIPLLEDFLRT